MSRQSKGLFVLLSSLIVACAHPREVAPLRYGDSRAADDSPFRQSPPPLPPIVEVVDSAPRTTTLPNGVRVVLVERHDFPVVATRLFIDRSSLDIGDAGTKKVRQLQYLYGGWGDESTAERARAELARTGVWMGDFASADALSWISSSPADKLDAAWALLAERYFGAKLSKDEYERRRAAWDDAVKRRGPSLLDAEEALLFGNSRHPYGYVKQGATISQEDAESLRARLLQPSHATLLVVGDVTPEKVDVAAARWFGGWKATGPELPRYMEQAPLRDGPRVAIARMRGLEHRQAAVFARGPEASSDDVEAFEVTAAILGGVGGKLFEREREEMGATYMVESPFFRLRSASWLAIGGSYDTDKALDAIAASLDGIRELRDGNVTDEEVAEAKSSLLANWRLTQATVDGAASAYESALSLGVGLERVRAFPERVGRVGRAEVVHVANVYLAEERLHVALTGGAHWHPTARLGLGSAVTIE